MSLKNEKTINEIRFISGEAKSIDDIETIFNRVVELFKMDVEQTKEICLAKVEVSASSLCRLAELCDASVELDYMSNKVTFYYNTMLITTELKIEKEKTEKASLFTSVKDDEDSGGFPF